MVGKVLRRHEFSGKRDQAVELPTGGVLKALRVGLFGLGPATELRTTDVRRMAAKGARMAAAARASSMAMLLPEGSDGLLPGAIRSAAEGAVFGAYRYERYKTGDRVTKFPLERVALLTSEPVDAEMRQAAALGQQVADAICMARDLINDPPNDLTPAALADFARQVCKTHGMPCTVLDDAAIRKKGMNLLAAVGQGSAHGPRLVHMKYRPAGKKELKKLVFVGKGLTFDTGGICIKPAAGMDEMKGDMGGAANVIALMVAVAITQPQAEIHGIIACAENMPDGKAYRPGDILGSYEGKTVEVINTDAEGRLALADALAYAKELAPDLLIDNATLTGACVVALGPTVSGFYSNRDEMAGRLRTAAKAAGEQMWQMPLVDDLREMLKSDWADIKHLGERWGGSITAALFLGEFVGDTPWIHIDIAGPSMANKPYDIYSKGGTRSRRRRTGGRGRHGGLSGWRIGGRQPIVGWRGRRGEPSPTSP
jgi:leucyl aminopeptidase